MLIRRARDRKKEREREREKERVPGEKERGDIRGGEGGIT